MRRLRILHISDLHERAAYDGMPASRAKVLKWDATNRGQVLGKKFQQALLNLAEGGVDLVCFTGDLADWGHPAEYVKATLRLEQILALVKVPRERFFAVPGNHDVQRNIHKQAWLGLRSWLARTHDVASLGRWVMGPMEAPPGVEATWLPELLLRTESFWAWMTEFRGDALRPTPTWPLGYRATLAAGAIEGFEQPVHIVGLDSAWLCGEDDKFERITLKDQGGIVVTEEQVDAHIRDGEHALHGIRIGLIHHPLDHLADNAAIRRLLGDDGVDILLHGHQHDPMSTQVRESGSTLRVLAAGCLIEGEMGKRWPNGFQLLELDPGGRSGSITFRKWAKDTRFWAKGSDIYVNAPDGVLAFSDADTHAATAPGQSQALPPAVLRLDTTRLVDRAGIRRLVETYGRTWPLVKVEWPESLQELISELKKGLQSDLGRPGGDTFAAEVPQSLADAEARREAFAKRIPAVVTRAAGLTDEQLVAIIHNLLLVANYKIHQRLAHLSGWQGLRPWTTPPDWKDFGGDHDMKTFGALLGAQVNGPRLPSGRLVCIEGSPIYDGGYGFYIHGPRYTLSGPRPIEICEWFIPQVECGLSDAALPSHYTLQGWQVDKLFVDDSGDEVWV